MNLRSCTLCVASLLAAACDPAEAPSWRDSAITPATSDELAALLPLCESLPAESAASEHPEGPPALADAPQVAEGVCQGFWEFKSDEGSCGSCAVERGNAGKTYTYYHRWCYAAPSPPSCGGCGPWEYENYSCLDMC